MTYLNSNDKPIVAVLYGGFSGEREVSIRSGEAVARGLKEAGISACLVDIVDDSWQWPDKANMAFLALHGRYGEDGTIQARLESLGIPYTGSDSKSSALAFDKSLARKVFSQAALPVARGCVLSHPESSLPDDMKFPVVIKPVADGSSLGLEFVDGPDEWPQSLKRSLSSGTSELVEERIFGREFTVGIFDDKTLPVIEIKAAAGGYNYTNKYTKGGSTHICPAELDENLTNLVSDLALQAFRALNCRHYGRVDVMCTDEGDPYILEVNTLPGMTELSLFPEAAGVSGVPFHELVSRMVYLAIESPPTITKPI